MKKFKCVDTIDEEGKIVFTILEVNNDLQYEIEFVEVPKENVILTGRDLAILRSTCNAEIEFVNMEKLSHRVYKADSVNLLNNLII